MRGVAIALCITLILAVFFVADGIYSKNVVQTVHMYTADIKDDIYGSGDTVKKLKKYWEKNENILMALSNHKVCNDISQSIARLEVYLNYGSEADMYKYAELKILNDYTDDIVKPEKLNWYNIF